MSFLTLMSICLISIFLIITIGTKGLPRFSCHENVIYLLVVATLSQGPLKQMNGKALDGSDLWWDWLKP